MSFITLTHPRTGTDTSFLLSSSKLFEIHNLDRGSFQSGSFLIGSDYLFPTSNMTIFTRIDPVLLLIPLIAQAAPETGPFIDYVDCMNRVIEQASPSLLPGMAKLIQALNSSALDDVFRTRVIHNIMETRQVLDRCLVRMNDEKVMNFFVRKLDSLVSVMSLTGGGIVECAPNPRELNKIVALELLRSYLSEDWYSRLTDRLGYNTDSLFALQVGNASGGTNSGSGDATGPVKRPAAGSGAPTAKKMKEIAVAKNCMKMTNFFKPKGC